MSEETAATIVNDGKLIEESELLQFRDPDQPNLNVVYWTRATPSTVSKETTNILFWIHGLSEHSGRVKRIAERLLTTCDSLDVMMSFDLRGHGKSEGKRGSSSGLDEHIDDTKLILPTMAIRYPNARLIVGGHSLGGQIACGLGMASDDILQEDDLGQIQGFFFSSPAFKITVRGFTNRIMAPIAPLLASFNFVRKQTKANEINSDDITHDKSVTQDYENDELVHDQASIGIGADLLVYGEKVIRTLKDTECNALILKPHIPTLIIHSPDDKITDCDGSRQLVDIIKQKRTERGQSVDNVALVEIKGAKHEIFNETVEFGRDKFYDALSAYIISLFSFGGGP